MLCYYCPAGGSTIANGHSKNENAPEPAMSAQLIKMMPYKISSTMRGCSLLAQLGAYVAIRNMQHAQTCNLMEP